GPAAAAVDRTPPTTPGSLRATATTPTSVSLAWNASTDNSGSLTYSVRETGSGQTRSVAQTQTAYAWTGLQASHTYRFVVLARDAAGSQSGNSNTVTVTTPAATAPAVPANLRVTGTTQTNVSLAWDAAAGAVSYTVLTEGLMSLPVAATSTTVT